jgi:hypothetical protein
MPRRSSALLAQLDSESFSKRDAATRALQKLGADAEPILQEALSAKPSLEIRQRLEQLLKALGPLALREWRAIKLLEHMGTQPAKELLDQLAQGADARLTREARAAAGRLRQRLPAKR